MSGMNLFGTNTNYVRHYSAHGADTLLGADSAWHWCGPRFASGRQGDIPSNDPRGGPEDALPAWVLLAWVVPVPVAQGRAV